MKRNKMKLGAILISILITIGIFAGCESKASEEKLQQIINKIKK